MARDRARPRPAARGAEPALAPSRARVDREKLKSIRVVFEDDALIAVSKPPGLSVHGGAGEPGPTLIELLREAAGTDRLQLVHRLDRATSGLISIARSAELAKAVQARWEAARKTYLALALGRIDRVLELGEPIADKHGRSREAFTRARPLAVLERVEPVTTLLHVELGTGRNHQIRIHLGERGHPLLMDDKHGDFAANKRWRKAVEAAIPAGEPKRSAKHLMLHSHHLELTHPRTKVQLRLTADPPEVWGPILSALGCEDPVALLAGLYEPSPEATTRETHGRRAP